MGWVDSGMVFTEPKGSPLRPEWIGERFDSLIAKYGLIRRGLQAGKSPAQLARRHNVSVAAVEVTRIDPLPPIRYHDLRHGAATLSLAAGVDMKVIAEHLGHSKSSFTSDFYTSVIPQVAQQLQKRSPLSCRGTVRHRAAQAGHDPYDQGLLDFLCTPEPENRTSGHKQYVDSELEKP